MFVAALLMLDVVGACAGMSQTMQLWRRCVALEDLTVDRRTEALDRAEWWEGEGWGTFQQKFDASTLVPRFLGVPLHNTEADFLSQANNFLRQPKCSLHTRFSDIDPVARATPFLGFLRWLVEDGMALASYANESVHLIAAHFVAVLGPLPKVVL